MYRRPVLCCLILSGLVLALLCSAAYAQTGSGSVRGTVKDITGAVIPSAKVKVTHIETAREFDTVTNGAGLYVFPSLQMGAYKITAEAGGFEKWAGDLLLQAGETAAVDSVLKVAAASAQITVAGDVTPVVTSTSGTLANVLERARIEQLPLNARFLQSLVMRVTPGMEGADTAPKVFGLRKSSMEFVQDGALLENRDTGEITRRPPGLDSVEEFRVETNNSSAKLNRPATTIVTTRSGTNIVHGAAFETARNSGLGVARRRQDFYTKPPHLVRNEFGASLGGPVYLPKLYNGKNRTFFFFSYEAYRSLGASTISNRMPTMEMRQGDFSGLIDSAGRRITIYDPWTTESKSPWQRQPFPNNVIPMSRQSPLAKYLYSVTPQSTMPQVNPLIGDNYFGPGVNNRMEHTETFKIDHRLSNRDQMFVRFTRGKSSTKTVAGENGSPTLLDESGNINFYPAVNFTGVFSWTHTFSPTFFGETMVAAASEDYGIFTGREPINWAARLGLPNPFNAVDLPYMNNTGFGMTYVAQNRRNSITNVVNADQNFTKVRGRHELQFGGRFRHEQLQVLPDQQFAQGNFGFNSLGTALYDPTTGSSYGAVPRTGHDSANLFLGITNGYAAQFNRKWYYLRAREYAGYFQDNWKATPKLTLNLGMRYELFPVIREKNNLVSGFDREQRALVSGTTLEKMYKMGATTPGIVAAYTKIGVKFINPEQAGLPDSLLYTNHKDFGPRLGFAYRLPAGKRFTVIRGGYSLFYFPIPVRTFNARMRRDPPTFATYSKSLNSAAESLDGLPNWGLRSAPQIIAGLNSKDVLDPNQPVAFTRGSFRIDYFDPNQPTSRAHQWNLTLEREIMRSTLLRLGYVGTHGSNMDQYHGFNEAPNSYVWYTATGSALPSGEYAGVQRRGWDQTTYGDIYEYRKTGWTNYNGVQLEVRRQYSRGYGFQFFYLVSNSFRVAGDGYNDDFVPEPNMFLPGAVPTDYDARNRFLNYRRDLDIPKHRMRWNWIVDLPFGRGKLLGRKAGPVLDRLIGGWQLAGFGSMRSNYWSLPTNSWGSPGEIEIYGKKYPIQDCRSGVCIRGYLYWNGYIPPNRINSTDAQGRPNGVMGVPDNYKPAYSYSIPWGSTTLPPTAPAGTNVSTYWDTDTVWIPLKNGTAVRTSIDTNLHPWRNQYVPGLRDWGLDASLFKMVRINERFRVRINADFFSVLNMPGTPQPSSTTGIISLQNNAWNPRVMQLTLRLQW